MKCSICGNEIPVTSYGWSSGNNAEPVNDGRCCDTCNDYVVIPARLAPRMGYKKALDVAKGIAQSRKFINEKLISQLNKKDTTKQDESK